jgi:hypothetical protein
VTLETIRHDKKAAEMPMLMMRDGTFLARDEATAQKAEMNSRRLYDLCDI